MKHFGDWPALMDVEVAAAYLGMSATSLLALVAAGVVKAPVRPFAAIQKTGAKGEGDGRFDREDLDEFREQLRAHRDAINGIVDAIMRGEPKEKIRERASALRR